MKTILQSQSTSKTTFLKLMHPKNFKMLTRGAGAQFLLSVPHGACNFAVLEYTRRIMGNIFGENKTGPALDFTSSAIATICCSAVSTPQMMITDNIMAGNFPTFASAIRGIYSESNNLNGFYRGWFPGIAGKIPSYGLTWVFFQQIKNIQLGVMKRPPTDAENTVMGCISSAATVAIM